MLSDDSDSLVQVDHKKRNKNLIATVAAGFPVTFSTIYNPASGGTPIHAHPRIVDNKNIVVGWCPQQHPPGEWLQVNFMQPRTVRAIETAGRNN